MSFRRNIRRYFSETSGQFAIWTAVAAFPISVAASLAIDARFVDREGTHLQSALDSAAIAAVTQQSILPTARAEYAKDRFWINFGDNQNTSVKVSRSDLHRIDMSAEIRVPSAMGIFGKREHVVSATAAAELVKGSTVCMLALDPDSARSFEVTTGATLDASCGIQVNSLHENASVVDLGGIAKAQSFCVAGGASGEHFPSVNTECSIVGDPYIALDIPAPGQCVDEKALQAKMQDWRSERDAIENHEIDENKRWADAISVGRMWYPTYFEKTRLSPGNYCNGLFMEGKEFLLDPGVYHITGGSLVFGLGTELIGEDVTFILHGEIDFEIRDGSILNVKAPTEGPLKGLVVAQDLHDMPISSPKYPNTTTTITDGAILNLLGTVYLPSHRVEFLGGSLAETRAPATSFIAHQISIRDGANIGVDVDHVAAGIPPIEPRSDSSARLVK